MSAEKLELRGIEYDRYPKTFDALRHAAACQVERERELGHTVPYDEAVVIGSAAMLDMFGVIDDLRNQVESLWRTLNEADI